MAYIQDAIKRIKGIELAEIKRLRAKGHKTLRFRIETMDAASKRNKKPASCAVPLAWLQLSKEQYEFTNKQDETVFTNTFISDWISGWA